MFDIGFSELLLIGIVALVVIGPERLPKVARTAGHLFGRLQRYVANVKADIAREMELDELRKFKGEVENAARSVERSISEEVSLAEREVRELAQEADRTIHSALGSETNLETNSPVSVTDEAPKNLSAEPSPQLELLLSQDATRSPESKV
jgi:sec-independent protein translocase protein TatB